MKSGQVSSIKSIVSVLLKDPADLQDERRKKKARSKKKKSVGKEDEGEKEEVNDEILEGHIDKLSFLMFLRHIDEFMRMKRESSSRKGEEHAYACHGGGILDEALRYLLHHLKSDEAIVRQRTVIVIDLLFMKYVEFRPLVAKNIKDIVGLSGVFIDTQQYTLPSNGNARTLRLQALQTLEIWDIEFGVRYPAIRALARYLRESLKIAMPNVLALIEARKRAEKKESCQQQNLLMMKTIKLLNELVQQNKNIQQALEVADTCFQLLFPDFSHSLVPQANEFNSIDAPKADVDIDMQWTDEIEVNPSFKKQKRSDIDEYADKADATVASASLLSINYTLELNIPINSAAIETGDNKAIMEQLHEIYRQLQRHILPRMHDDFQTLNSVLEILRDQSMTLLEIDSEILITYRQLKERCKALMDYHELAGDLITFKQLVDRADYFVNDKCRNLFSKEDLIDNEVLEE